MKYCSEKSFKLFHRQTFFHSAVETCVLPAGIRAPWMIRKKLWQVARDLSEGKRDGEGWTFSWEGWSGKQASGAVEDKWTLGSLSSRKLWKACDLPSARKPVSLEDERSCRTKRSLREKTSWGEVRRPGINSLQSREVLVPPHWIMGIQDNADDKSKKGSWGGKMMDAGIHHRQTGQFLTTELPSVLFKDWTVIYLNQ